VLRSGSLLRLIAFAALTLGACARGAGPAIEATFPPSSDGLVDAMVVSLVDQTGLVTATTVAAGAGATGDGGPRVVAEPGDPNALRLEWLGSDCDGRTSIVLVESGDDYLATIHVDPTPAGGFGCGQIDLPRALTVHLREPIAPERITITQQFP